MRPVARSLVVFAVVAAASLLSAPVAAALSIDQAAAQLRRDSGARIVGAEVRQRQGREVYRFKVLGDKGRVRTIWIDPVSGRRLRR